jgi:hypothetical protein
MLRSTGESETVEKAAGISGQASPARSANNQAIGAGTQSRGVPIQRAPRLIPGYVVKKLSALTVLTLKKLYRYLKTAYGRNIAR